MATTETERMLAALAHVRTLEAAYNAADRAWSAATTRAERAAARYFKHLSDPQLQATYRRAKAAEDAAWAKYEAAYAAYQAANAQLLIILRSPLAQGVVPA